MDPVTLLAFAAGVAVLVVGAEALVRGSGRLATNLGVPPLVIGLTVVAFGTSAPELAVGVSSALAGEADIALGNVVGSNIANVLLVLGLAALVVPVVTAPRVVRREVPVMIGVSALLWLMAASGRIDRLEGVLLLVGIIAYSAYLAEASRRAAPRIRTEFADEFGAGAGRGPRAATVNLAVAAVGLAMLVVGASLIVDSAVAIATTLGVPELVVGLTIVAVGTSLPEIATSVTAGLRGHRDIAVGNVVGSCIFNVLMVVGASAVVSPTPLVVSSSLLAVDLPLMVAAAVACLPVLYTRHLVDRREGALLLGFYVAYLAYLGLIAVGDPLAETVGAVLILGAVPLAAIVLAVASGLEWRRKRVPLPVGQGS